jgi:hypothetical protein
MGLGEGECPGELLALRALVVFNPEGDAPAKAVEHRRDLRECHPRMIGEAPLAQWPVFHEQHREDPGTVRQSELPPKNDEARPA